MLPTIALGLFFITGCESIEKVDPTRPLPTELTPPQLLAATKASWEACLADFYRDDWMRMNDHVMRFSELAGRWKAVEAPPEKRKELDEASASFGQAVTELKTAVDAKNVDGVTQAMRKLGRRIAQLEMVR